MTNTQDDSQFVCPWTQDGVMDITGRCLMCGKPNRDHPPGISLREPFIECEYPKCNCPRYGRCGRR